MSANVHSLVERQMRNWELARQQGRTPRQAEPVQEIHPFITLSRQLGSGGLSLARVLGSRLGWQVYDRELLGYMAEKDDVQRRLYALRDERHEGWLGTLMSALSPETPHRPDDYFHKLSRAVSTVSRHESAIFVGRGAHFVLPPARGVRVRVVAPIEHCAAAVARRESVSMDDARKKVRETGAQRDAFLRAHFVSEPWSADHYDLVLNMAGLSPDAAAEIVLAALAAKTGYRPQDR